MAIEKFSQLNYSQKACKILCCYKPRSGNWENHYDPLQEILVNATTENKLYFVT